jgi:hypothetical protein
MMRGIHLVKVLQEVFDEVWQEIEPKSEGHNDDERRSELARRIILAHQSGLKPHEIKTAILTRTLPRP